MAEIGSPAADERALSTVLRVVGAIFVVFFAIALIGSATQSEMPDLLYRLFGWGSIGDAEEQMLSAVYIVLGVFLWLAAADPLRHRLFIDFVIVANAAHFLVMGIQAIVIPGEHLHLVGDVLLGWLLVVLLLVVWVPARRRATRVA